MGDILSAAKEEEDKYRRLCMKYEEKVQLTREGGLSFPDWNGEHSKSLQLRESLEK